MSIRLDQIWIYPVKGMKGIPLQTAKIERAGIRFDRRWMLVGADHRFISQRTSPMLATFATRLTPSGSLVLTSPHGDSIEVWEEQLAGETSATIWSSTVTVGHYHSPVDEWCSAMVGVQCRLVRLAPSEVRPTNPNYSSPGDRVSLADGYPVTLATAESLAELNRSLPTPVGMERFRPNLVVSGASAPWIEERWETLIVGAVPFRLAKPCGRCSVITVDQETGESQGEEPLRTLATLRTVGRSRPVADFSINLLPDAEGSIERGAVIRPCQTAHPQEPF